MRIITGKYKKHELNAVPGNTARPTTDFLKETLFNILPDCENISFLDLYAGSGSVGFEALSRGAKEVTFVEFSQKAINIIISNIKKLNCQDQCNVVRRRSISYIKKCINKFNIVFLDPPYNKNLVNKTIAELIQSKIVSDGGLIVVEHHANEKIDAAFQYMIIQEKGTRHSGITILRPIA